MASVKWTEEGLTSLAQIDAWRYTQGWRPIVLELMTAIEIYFHRWDPSQPPRFVPGRPVELDDGVTESALGHGNGAEQGIPRLLSLSGS